MIGTGDGGQGGRGGDIGCNNVALGHQQNHISGSVTGPQHIQVAGNQINYNASRLKGN